MKPRVQYELSDCLAMQRAFTEMVVNRIETGDDKKAYAWGIRLIGDHIARTGGRGVLRAHPSRGRQFLWRSATGGGWTASASPFSM